VRSHGINAFYDSVELRKACCGVRKMEPLRRALAGRKAWITGLRAAQSVTRAPACRCASVDTANGLAKLNPLSDWSETEVWAYIRINEVPYNALHDQFYPSIGCAPCTRADRRRRGRARRALVVGEPGLQGVRPARQGGAETMNGKHPAPSPRTARPIGAGAAACSIASAPCAPA
jgi:3'-phosphoadenosine 5'-phosphosulfate sulfotransferase (PAPS reductase)/FAD synthetase